MDPNPICLPDQTQVGYYAKDKDISTSTSPSLKESLGMMFRWDGDENGGLKVPTTNILDAIPETDLTVWSGLRINRAWMYSGFGIAGWHAEDSFMDFYNTMPKFMFEGLSWMETAVVEYIRSISMKRWIFLTHDSDMVSFSTALNRHFPLSPFGIDILHARTVLLNPAHLDSDKFFVVYQKPGDTVGGHRAHCVSGYSLLNLAYNYQDYADINDYQTRVLPAEFEIGDIRRQQMFAVDSLNILLNNIITYAPISYRGFIITNELIEYFIYDTLDKFAQPGMVQSARAALTTAYRIARSEQIFPIARGTLSTDQFDMQSARQCDICRAPCPIEIYDLGIFTPAPTTSTTNPTGPFTCTPCTFLYMTWKHRSSTTITIPKLITFISDMQIKSYV
jgi:hypothetical protein